MRWVAAGGSFTDLSAWNEANSDRTAKVSAGKEDRSEAALQASKTAELDSGDISYLLRGTTTGMSSLIGRSCPDAAFVPTEVSGDMTLIGQCNDQLNLTVNWSQNGMRHHPDAWLVSDSI